MSKLILLRHGQSEWNKQNLFTGWIDIPLSQKGIEEAILAGVALSEYNIDVVYVSNLIRSHMTAFISMAQSKLSKIPYIRHESDEDPKASWYEKGTKEDSTLIPVYKAWELNERMYGFLQAKSKPEVMKEYGESQFKLWRRSYDVPPPEGESLEQTAQRTLPFFKNRIEVDLQKGKDVFVCAHGNSLRSIVMEIDGLSKEEVLELEIPTGVPLIYEYLNGIFEKVNS